MAFAATLERQLPIIHLTPGIQYRCQKIAYSIFLSWPENFKTNIGSRAPGYKGMIMERMDGFYFVTICTKNRLRYFSDIIETNGIGANNDPSLRPTEKGQIAIGFWNEIPKYYPFVELDEYVVMPNHIHGILFFNKPDKTDWQPNQFGPQSQNPGAVIQAYKSSVKRYANQNNIEFRWQSRFHDHIIRNDHALNNIAQYIITHQIPIPQNFPPFHSDLTFPAASSPKK